MKKMVIGIMSQKKSRERILAIARGDIKPKADEPKIWFTSIKSLAQVLSDDNRALLELIKETQPDSIFSLAELTGRRPRSLSHILKKMASYGIIEIKREKHHMRPIVKSTAFQINACI